MVWLTVNGRPTEVAADDDTPLLWLLRETLGLTGTKVGCTSGQCGACSVLVEGRAARSCQLPANSLGDQRITTVEGLGGPLAERLKAAWIAHQVPQCGYCQPGMLVSAVALLSATPEPTPAEIAATLTNLCRCGTFDRISAAIRQASQPPAPPPPQP